MRRKEMKEKKKKHYVELIRKNEPIRPEELKTKFGVKRVRYDYITELCSNKEIDRKPWGKHFTLLFMPGHEALADEKFHSVIGKGRNHTSSRIQEQELRLDFKPIIIAWKTQLTYWKDFFTPWVHSNELKFPLWDGYHYYLPVENEPTYPHLKKYMKELIEKNPDLCINPFDEQDRLKKMLMQYDAIRDSIAQEMEQILNKKRLGLEKEKKRDLLSILFARMTNEIPLQEESPDLVFLSAAAPDYSDFAVDDKTFEDIVKEVKKSSVITPESFTKLYQMLSAGQQMVINIDRALEILLQIKD